MGFFLSSVLNRVAYLRAKSSLLMKVALHEVTIFPGCNFTPWRKQTACVKQVNQVVIHPVCNLFGINVSLLTSLWFQCSRVGLWWYSLYEAGWYGSLCCTWYKPKSQGKREQQSIYPDYIQGKNFKIKQNEFCSVNFFFFYNSATPKASIFYTENSIKVAERKMITLLNCKWSKISVFWGIT